MNEINLNRLEKEGRRNFAFCKKKKSDKMRKEPIWIVWTVKKLAGSTLKIVRVNRITPNKKVNQAITKNLAARFPFFKLIVPAVNTNVAPTNPVKFWMIREYWIEIKDRSSQLQLLLIAVFPPLIQHRQPPQEPPLIQHRHPQQEPQLIQNRNQQQEPPQIKNRNKKKDKSNKKYYL